MSVASEEGGCVSKALANLGVLGTRKHEVTAKLNEAMRQMADITNRPIEDWGELDVCWNYSCVLQALKSDRKKYGSSFVFKKVCVILKTEVGLRRYVCWLPLSLIHI